MLFTSEGTIIVTDMMPYEEDLTADVSIVKVSLFIVCQTTSAQFSRNIEVSLQSLHVVTNGPVVGCHVFKYIFYDVLIWMCCVRLKDRSWIRA